MKTKIMAVILCVCLVALSIWTYVTFKELGHAIDNLERTKKQLQETISKQESYNDQLISWLSQKEIKLVEQGGIISDYKKEVFRLDAEVSNYKYLLDEKNEIIQRQKNMVNEHERELIGISNQVNDYQSLIGKLETESARLNREVKKWKDAYQRKPNTGSGLREFRSEQELSNWLAADKTDENSYIPNQFDCDDFARMLQSHAFNDGYIISIAMVRRGDGLHVKNACLIGNKFYYIEPQNDSYYFQGYVD